MKDFVCVISVALVFSLTVPQSACADEEPTDAMVVPTSQGDAIKVPEDVKNDGAFRYFLPFDLPEFRDLVPNIGISYASSFKGHGAENVYMGAGWRLSGLSSVERVSVGGGVPTYVDGHDIYRIDGIELLLCDDSAATSQVVQFWTYPDRYKTENTSASCSAGGTLAPLIEDYSKYEAKLEWYNQGFVSYLLVTKPNGITYKYETVGKLAGEGHQTDDVHENIRFNRKWLLTTITDTQSVPNVVNITYAFDPDSSRGFASRPDTITYGSGYEVKFMYEDHWMSSYAIGGGANDYMGIQDYRLSALTVKNNGTEIRAYDFIYNDEVTSASAGGELTEVSLLRQVDQYGDDFTTSGSDIVSGSKLPSPLKNLEYNSEEITLTEKTYPGTSFSVSHINELPLSLDRNNDGISTLRLLQRDEGGSQCEYYDADKEKWFPSGTLSSYFFPAVTQNFDKNGDPSSADILIQNSRYHVPLYSPRNNKRIDVGYGLDGLFKLYDVENNNSVLDSLDTSEIPNPYLWDFRDFDADGEPEVMFSEKIYDIENGQFVLADSSASGAYDPGPYHPEYGGYIADRDLYPVIVNVDIDGDGTAERLESFSGNPRLDQNIGGGSPFYVAAPSDHVTLWDPRDGYLETNTLNNYPVINGYSHFFRHPSTSGGSLSHYPRVSYGDVNGDGAADMIIFDYYQNVVRVGLSSGRGFRTPTVWYQGVPVSWDDMDGSFTLSDINSDGLVDFVAIRSPRTDLLETCGTGSNRGGEIYEPYLQRDAYVMLSNGTKFTHSTMNSTWAKLPNFLTLGDFDGNGLIDTVAAGEVGTIHYQFGPFPNLLTSFTDGKGGTTLVEYTPSTQFDIEGFDYTYNEFPFVSQLVTKIVRQDGFGVAATDRTTTFNYYGGKYDYDYRKSLGFQTVVAQLPAIEGEGGEGPRVVTNYQRADPQNQNDHMIQNELIYSQLIFQGGKLHSASANIWDIVTNGTGPYRAQKLGKRSGELFANAAGGGDDFVWTGLDFIQDVFGQYETITDLGFVGYTTSENANEQDNVLPVIGDWALVEQEIGNDSTVSTYSYARNLTDYIVNRPSEKVLTDPQQGDTVLQRFTYVYDNQADNTVAPNRGNLTKLQQWNGTAARDVQVLGYDGRGNVLTETDALGNTTTHGYDTIHNLFRTSTTNAKGHVTATEWDYECQSPAVLTDPNGLETEFDYDVFCRESEKMLPGGQVVKTAYYGFGFPQLQNITKKVKSASAVSSPALQTTIEYFDGFGQTYAASHSGATSSLSDYVVQFNGFDKRGNKAWETIPLNWAEAGQFDAATDIDKMTRFTYDPMGRVLEAVMADGSMVQTNYLFETGSSSQYSTFGGVNLPSIRTLDARCDDGDDATLCGVSRVVSDSRGNVIAQVLVEGADETTGAGGSDHAIDYEYDLLNRLVRIQDPADATWVYEYDPFGNRIVSYDPGLGDWMLSYDANNNLTSQLDANGHEIEFDYDVLNRVTQKRVIAAITFDTYTTVYCYDGDPGCGHGIAIGASNIGHLTDAKIADPSNAELHKVAYDYGDNGQVVSEVHTVDGNDITFANSYTESGALSTQSLPTHYSSSIMQSEVFTFDYDAASQIDGLSGDANGPLITMVTYDVWGNPAYVTYGNGASEVRAIDAQRGWLDSFEVEDNTLGTLELTTYTRSADGRVTHQETTREDGDFDYVYDYAGRLLSAANTGALAGQYDQTFTYDAAGRMLSNSHVGNYSYPLGVTDPTGGSEVSPHVHAPNAISDGSTLQTLNYDGNGNMIAGLDSKIMTYDAENRPLSVNNGANETTYVYGAEGVRLKKIEKTGTGEENTTLYVGPVEIRKWGDTGNEEVIAYPHPNIRLVDGNPAVMHRDQLGSVRVITTASGSSAKESIYKPFGEATDWTTDPSEPIETKGFIGERYDADAGLQFLNARYYDPKLSLFILPDRLGLSH